MIDTLFNIARYIAASGTLSTTYTDTALDQCYRTFVTENTSDKAMKISNSAGFEFVGSSFHDAGYDAYCTGCVFANQLLVMASQDSLESSKNKLFMMQSLYHMNLDTNMPEDTFKYEGSMLHISKFKKETTTADILAPFLAANYSNSVLEVIWIDEHGIFVSINVKTPDANTILKYTSFPDDWTVKTFASYLENKKEQISSERGTFVSSLFEIGNAIGTRITTSIFGVQEASLEEQLPKKRKVAI